MTIPEAAQGLSDLILKVRDQVCGKGDDRDDEDFENFRVYLVAHSMGGLVCRCMLQNEAYGSAEARELVDKVFTYGTPHNGIDVAGINIPGFFSLFDINNFNRDTMREYLDIDDDERADSLDGKFDRKNSFAWSAPTTRITTSPPACPVCSPAK